MRKSVSLGILAAVFASVAALPASAHQRQIESMDGGLDGNKLTIYTYLNKRHQGKMYITLYKDQGGEWQFVDRKQADKISRRGYKAEFPDPSGEQMCKVRARFKVDGHDIPPESGELPC